MSRPAEAPGADAQAAEPAGWVDRRWTSADGLSLHARDYAAAAGEARLPLICLHGLTRNCRDFETLAPWIAEQGRRVLAVDIRGRGLSDYDPEPLNYVPKTYARDLIAMMDALGIARAVFLGTSMGGIIMMALAALRTGAVAAAILNDVGPVVSPEGVDRIKSYTGRPVEITSWEEAAAYARRINDIAFPDLDDAAWDRFARRTFRDVGGVPMLDYDPRIMIPLGQGREKAPTWLAWLLFRRLARKRPTLLARGAQSDILSRATAERMKAAAPAMDFVEVGNVGHAPMLDEPEAMDAIARFLERIA